MGLPVSLRLISLGTFYVYPPQLVRKVGPSSDFHFFQSRFFQEGMKIARIWFRIIIYVKKCSRKHIQTFSLMTHPRIMTSQTWHIDGHTLRRYNSEMSHQWISLDVFSETLYHVDDESEIRFELSFFLLEKIGIEKNGNLLMGQLCGPIVADRHNMCPS